MSLLKQNELNPFLLLGPALCLILQATVLPMATQGQEPAFGAVFESIEPASAGVDFVHTDGGTGKRYIMETVVGGLASFDYDCDGRVDLYLVNGIPLGSGAHEALGHTRSSNRLYRNLGRWKFVDVTGPSGLTEFKHGMGVTVADYNEDGLPDLFVSNFGSDTLYRNNGDGTFDEVTQASGIPDRMRFGAGSAFFDMDGDSDLDLYTASYVEFSYENHRTRSIAGHEFHIGPNDFPPAQDHLYRNEGNGTFVEVSQAAGIADLRAPGMGVLAADFDFDNDIDVLVANDQKPNSLLINDGHGKFTDDAWLAGIAVDRLGRMNGNMGLDYGDVDGNGFPDILTTTYQEEMPVLYLADAPGLFRDATSTSRIAPSLKSHVNWGIGAVDFDNDGDLDIFIACGHFLDNIQYIDDRTSLRTPNYLLANDGSGRFIRVLDLPNSSKGSAKSSRGAVFEDFDRDGAIDIAVLNANDQLTLLRTRVVRSESSADDRSIQIRLIGTQSNRDAVGARLTVHTTDGRSQTKQVMSGRGYESHYGTLQHFGTRVGFEKLVDVKWPSGESENFELNEKEPVLIQGMGRALATD